MKSMKNLTVRKLSEINNLNFHFRTPQKSRMNGKCEIKDRNQ